MKKIVLLSAAVLAAGSATIAQQTEGTRQVGAQRSFEMLRNDPVAMKTTGASDTGFYTLSLYIPKGTSNIYTRQVFDTSTVSRLDRALPLDSGYVYGTNPSGARGFAEQMYFRYKSDTSLRILGVRTLFSGRVQSTSTKQVTFGIWKVGAETSAGTKKFNSGLPTTVLGSLTVSARSLGTGGGSGVDTFKNFFFANRINMAAVDSDFFVGYTMPAYTFSGGLANDTFGMRSSRGGTGFNVGSFLRGTDTVHGNQNVFMDASGTWRDLYWDYLGGGYIRNLSIVPIVQLAGSKFTFGVNSYTRDNITFFGNYPNPAVSNTTVRFSLKNASAVSFELTDISGRVIRRESFGSMTAGQHDVNVSVADLASGNYVYMIRTAEGDAVASQLTVAK